MNRWPLFVLFTVLGSNCSYAQVLESLQPDLIQIGEEVATEAVSLGDGQAILQPVSIVPSEDGVHDEVVAADGTSVAQLDAFWLATMGVRVGAPQQLAATLGITVLMRGSVFLVMEASPGLGGIEGNLGVGTLGWGSNEGGFFTWTLKGVAYRSWQNLGVFSEGVERGQTYAGGEIGVGIIAGPDLPFFIDLAAGYLRRVSGDQPNKDGLLILKVGFRKGMAGIHF